MMNLKTWHWIWVVHPYCTTVRQMCNYIIPNPLQAVPGHFSKVWFIVEFADLGIWLIFLLLMLNNVCKYEFWHAWSICSFWVIAFRRTGGIWFISLISAEVRLAFLIYFILWVVHWTSLIIECQQFEDRIQGLLMTNPVVGNIIPTVVFMCICRTWLTLSCRLVWHRTRLFFFCVCRKVFMKNERAWSITVLYLYHPRDFIGLFSCKIRRHVTCLLLTSRW